MSTPMLWAGNSLIVKYSPHRGRKTRSRRTSIREKGARPEIRSRRRARPAKFRSNVFAVQGLGRVLYESHGIGISTVDHVRKRTDESLDAFSMRNEGSTILASSTLLTQPSLSEPSSL